MTDDYAPFSEAALEDIAQYHDDAAGIWPEGSGLRATHKVSAQIIRNAIKCHEALRESKLTEMAELRGECGRLRAELEKKNAA